MTPEDEQKVCIIAATAAVDEREKCVRELEQFAHDTLANGSARKEKPQKLRDGRYYKLPSTYGARIGFN